MTILRKMLAGLLSAGLAVGSMAATVATAAEKVKVAFVYVGPVGDGGYTYQHELGRRALQEALGDKI
ncbi:BMP family ABC transporter substrate-binding protein, partial [Acinetobacter baumannii]